MSRPRLFWHCNPHNYAGQPARLVFWVFWPNWPARRGAGIGPVLSVPHSTSPAELGQVLRRLQRQADAALAAEWAWAAERL